MKKFLITGGAGYIGSMLCTKLIDLGYQVTVLDKLKYENVRPLFAQEIIYDKLDQKMFMAIILTLLIFIQNLYFVNGESCGFKECTSEQKILSH